MADLKSLEQAIIEGNMAQAKQTTQQCLAEGIDPLRLFREALIPGMAIVGEKMKAEEYYIPEVLLSARAMKAAAEILRPLLAGREDSKPLGRVVAGTVFGDLHDIGKNLVCMMMEGAGFEIIDLGVNVSADQFVNTVKEKQAEVVAMSAMLTTTMLQMREVVRALEAAGLRDKVKVMVGGAPLTKRFADEIAADGFAPDAASAAQLAKSLLGTAAGN